MNDFCHNAFLSITFFCAKELNLKEQPKMILYWNKTNLLQTGGIMLK